ncbi:hypothetical protein FEM48_Zijuj01G0033900 [Ziziphus jujuba var. spinosa]|uniref:Glutaredoxin domain-containing protein n=1 Tax=Ziziphus jujuba var. spinosa TaxID=714518 RepID=A0A978VYV5_ZIZJJ|nr:hypothetical protein FEM48_Zijuj01G0033900 [Ziziphus jujuba var. spinosa]
MQHAIPYRTWVLDNPATHRNAPETDPTDGPSSSAVIGGGDARSVQRMVSENAVVVFGKSGCCMCHVIKRLLLGHGVNPAVFEVDEVGEANVVDQLSDITGGEAKEDGRFQFPVVFVGGKVFGGLESVMASHISGELVPILKQAGALWL